MSEASNVVGSDTVSSDNEYNVYNPQSTHIVRPTEEWKDIPDWPYQASSMGNIRRVNPDGFGPNLKGGKSGSTNKYPNIVLHDGLRKKTFLRHYLISLVFHGPTPEGYEIDHDDGNRENCREDNLCFKTPSQNIQGSVARGHRGSHRWNAKLTEELVLKIRQMQRQGMAIPQIFTEIRKEVPVNFCAVYHVVMGHNWKHVA